MVLWVTTIILPSFLETNCPAKPHSYRPVCSEGSTKISQNNSWGIFLSSTYCDCLVQHRASGRWWHVTPSGGTSYLEKISTQLALLVGDGAQRGSRHLSTTPPPAPPTCRREGSASASFWSLAPDGSKMPHCCVPVAPVQPSNVVSCTPLSNHKPWKHFISSCRIISLWIAYPS